MQSAEQPFRAWIMCESADWKWDWVDGELMPGEYEEPGEEEKCEE